MNLEEQSEICFRRLLLTSEGVPVLSIKSAILGEEELISAKNAAIRGDFDPR